MVFQLIKRLFKRGKIQVGKDLAGNSYFEYNGRRFVEPKVVVKHFYDLPELPVQWIQWLRKTRKDPPTLEELKSDERRKIILAQRVAALKASEAIKFKNNTTVNENSQYIFNAIENKNELKTPIKGTEEDTIKYNFKDTGKKSATDTLKESEKEKATKEYV